MRSSRQVVPLDVPQRLHVDVKFGSIQRWFYELQLVQEYFLRSAPPFTMVPCMVEAFPTEYLSTSISAMAMSQLTNGDTELLKANHSYWLKQSIRKENSFEAFCHSSNAVVNHHFNDHTYCGKWCAWLRANAEHRKEIEKNINAK